MSNYKRKTRDWIKHKKVSIIPAPDRILIKITKKQIDDLISKEITMPDGSKKRIFFEPILHDPGYDASFRQNVSVGEVIAIGENIHDVNVVVGDIVILDYLVSSDDDDVVGFFNGDKIISILAKTTYYKDSATIIHGKAAWLKGDFDNISRILGVVRRDKLIPFDPYVFLEYESDTLRILNSIGENYRNPNAVIKRKVIAVPPECEMYEFGNDIYLKRDDWFYREVNGRLIAICFKQDILCKV